MSKTAKHFDISQLPSLKHGMTAEEEATRRRKTCRFIEEAGRQLKLPRLAIATAEVFFHRFYAKHSFQEHDRFEVAVACIVLAAKTEESPKKLNFVIDECHKLKQRGMQAGRISQNSTSLVSSSASATSLDPKGEEFLKLKERILLLERVILHTIGFELSIEHPYKFLVEQTKKLVPTRQLEYITPSNLPASQTVAKMQNEIMQYAMNFANDSMQSSLCLQFEPQMIAAACVYLAGHFAKVRPTNNKSWLELLGDPDVESLASIAVQIMEVITDKRSVHAEAFQKVRNELEKLKSGKPSPPEGKPAPPPRPPPAEARDPKRPRTG